MAESGFTGLAAGAALLGLRPVVEYQFADFISAAFDQIVNVMARHHYRTGDPMPIRSGRRSVRACVPGQRIPRVLNRISLMCPA
jgi:pyruvate/2-oxoglutarate/acetoin dehydrogenase E1 component